ncbi:MAG: alkaline phosphatase family protein [Pseudobdellovibrionaceae bacterium]
MFENADYTQAIAQKDFLNLSAKGTLFTNFTAETHPSQGNYLAMIAGTDHGVRNDEAVNFPDSHLGDLLEKAGKDWRVYAEDYPGSCFTGMTSGKYARKHVPFLSFMNVTKNPKRCGKVQSDTHFDQDLKLGSLPEFSMYIPNLNNDGHDTGVEFAGKWLTKRFGSLLSQPSALGEVLFIITFDEGDRSPKNQIFTLLLGSHIQVGLKNTAALNHISILKMIEDEWALGNLGTQDQTAAPVQGIWK